MGVSEYTNKQWDLIVVGGGMTGVAAAVAARRLGLDVLILEKAGFLGGAAGTCLINPFMPYSTQVDGKRLLLSQGFFTELRAMLNEIGGYRQVAAARTSTRSTSSSRSTGWSGARGQCSRSTTRRCAGVEKDGETHQGRSSVATQGRRAAHCGAAYVHRRHRRRRPRGVMAGCPYHLGRPDGLCQPMTLCFRIGNVDIPTYTEEHGR